jgi:hypothetical protein
MKDEDINMKFAPLALLRPARPVLRTPTADLHFVSFS